MSTRLIATLATLAVLFVCVYPPSPTVLGTSVARRFIWSFPARPEQPKPQALPPITIDAPAEVKPVLTQADREDLILKWGRDNAQFVRNLPMVRAKELAGQWADQQIADAQIAADKANTGRTDFLARHGPQLVVPRDPRPAPDQSLLDKATAQLPAINVHGLILEVLGIISAAALVSLAARRPSHHQ